MNVQFGLIGAGGFGREVMPFARASVAKQLSLAERDIDVYFVETWAPAHDECNGRPVVSLSTFLDMSGERYFNIAIGDGNARAEIVRQIGSRARPTALMAPNVVMLERNDIGDGAVFCPNSMVTSNAKIGRFFQANIYSYVAHDCVIGDYVTFAPGVRCNGHVIVEDYAYIGTSAVIKQGSEEKPLVIGKGAIVGMGAVVTKDVPAGVTVVGNPARLLVKK